MRFYIVLSICVFKIAATLAQTNTAKPNWPANPQTQNIKQKNHVHIYSQFNTGAGLLWAKNAALSQSFSFNYSSTILNPSTQTATTYKSNFMGTNLVNANYLGIQVGVGKFYIDLAEGGYYASRHSYNKANGFQTQLTTGANLPLHINQQKITMQFAVGLYYRIYQIGLAQINNTNAYINIFGEQPSPIFYYHSSSKGGYNGLAYAHQLDVDYSNTQTYFTPKLGISSKLFHSGFSLSVAAQYNLPIHQHSIISLTQTGSDNNGNNNLHNTLADVSINNPALSIYTNGKPSTVIPYTAKGLSLTLTLAYTLKNQKPAKHKKPKLSPNA
ncbi:MAG TPA: hypothetical protein VK835_04470 [Bacteroidia bacterium]|jgi:hypothetical protein|nr:hypothetical protein [Bacteroidia bacterium]